MPTSKGHGQGSDHRGKSLCGRGSALPWNMAQTRLHIESWGGGSDTDRYRGDCLTQKVYQNHVNSLSIERVGSSVFSARGTLIAFRDSKNEQQGLYFLLLFELTYNLFDLNFIVHVYTMFQNNPVLQLSALVFIVHVYIFLTCLSFQSCLRTHCI